MNIPQAARARQALSAFYGDSLSSTRVVVNGNFTDKTPVLPGVKCHLSVTQGDALEQTDTAAGAVLQYTVFAPPGTDIKMGDMLTVHRKGQTFTGKAGQPIAGSFSISTPLTEVRIS